MIGRTSGYVVMLELMKHLASQADPPVGVATMRLAEQKKIWDLLVLAASEVRFP